MLLNLLFIFAGFILLLVGADRFVGGAGATARNLGVPPLLICEGPTDTAAMLDLGFDAAGRPSCRGGIHLLVDLTRRRQPAEIVVVSDGDGPGRQGAESLASVLVLHTPAVRVIRPPHGITAARAWKRAGATYDDVVKSINDAEILQLNIRVSKRQVPHGR